MTRKIYRHESNKGSVIEYDMYGKQMKLSVPDAKYRPDGVYAWGMYNQKIPEIQNFDNIKFTSIHLLDDNDSALQSKIPSFRVLSTAKQNTDILMRYNASAAKACRDTDVGLGPMDLPNIYELMVIFQEADNLDVLDPTFNDFKVKGLGCNSTYGRFGIDEDNAAAWSSTSHCILGALYINYHGRVYLYPRSSSNRVVPVLEIFNS